MNSAKGWKFKSRGISKYCIVVQYRSHPGIAVCLLLFYLPGKHPLPSANSTPMEMLLQAARRTSSLDQNDPWPPRTSRLFCVGSPPVLTSHPRIHFSPEWLTVRLSIAKPTLKWGLQIQYHSTNIYQGPKLTKHCTRGWSKGKGQNPVLAQNNSKSRRKERQSF